ncbi:transcriptional regulator TetR family [Firmicutes bacterium CAG:449]|nr:transcriptional regulator TetR family [Firmicutes bacterium CAG:449]
MKNIENKLTKNVINVTSKLSGLKAHSQEINKISKESLITSLILLMKQKPYDKITISELCIKAGVSRTAFYGNFKTKDDLLTLYVLNMNTELINKIGSPFRNDTSLDWYINLFQVIKDNSEILILIFKAGFQKKYLEILNSMVLHNPSIPIEKKYQRLIWSGGVENALSYWLLESSLKESVEDIALYCHKNLNGWKY